MKHYTLDRVEGEIAVLQDDNRKSYEFPAADLPPNIHEGDCLYILKSGGFVVDKDETESRREKNRKLQEMLFKK